MVDSVCIIGASPPPPQPAPEIKYGVTMPILLDGLTEADLQRNAELEKFSIASGLYKSTEETAMREEVLMRINEVHGPGADLDTLCVVPSYVNREISSLFCMIFWLKWMKLPNFNQCRMLTYR